MFAKQKGDSAHVKNAVAHIIRGLGQSKVVIKSDQGTSNDEYDVFESLLRLWQRSSVVAKS